MRRTGFVTLCLLSLGVAGYAITVYGLMPLGAVLHPDMCATFEANRWAIYAHIFASTVALSLGPLQFSSRLCITLHRWLGTALPFLMLVVWRLKPNAEAAAAGRSGPLYAIALSVVAAAILAQAYLGAEVTHGAGHMAF